MATEHQPLAGPSSPATQLLPLPYRPRWLRVFLLLRRDRSRRSQDLWRLPVKYLRPELSIASLKKLAEPQTLPSKLDFVQAVEVFWQDRQNPHNVGHASGTIAIYTSAREKSQWFHLGSRVMLIRLEMLVTLSTGECRAALNYAASRKHVFFWRKHHHESN